MSFSWNVELVRKGGSLCGELKLFDSWVVNDYSKAASHRRSYQNISTSEAQPMNEIIGAGSDMVMIQT